MNTPALLPVGQRPRCRACGRELRPNFHTPELPYSFFRSDARPAVKQWRADHPKTFSGTYGAYRDNRFCGLRCGYKWAVKHAE